MKHFYLLFLLFGLAACGDSETTDEESGLENNFHIEGTISGASMQRIYIEAASQRGNIQVAETTTDALGKFSLDGNIPGMGIYTMRIGENPANTIAFPLEEKDQLTVNATFDLFTIAPKLAGTTWAKPLTTYMRLFGEASTKMADLQTIADPAVQEQKRKEVLKPIETFARKQINADPGNAVNILLTSIIAPSPEAGFADWDEANLELLKKIDAAFQKKYSNSPIIAQMSQQIAQIEAAYQQYAQFNSGTLAAPEIALNNPKGMPLRLSALKGRVVLVDFWASWCGPCRKENPNVVRLYKKFRSKGFEVFSVSLDEDPAAWKAAIEKDGLIWSNHVSDQMGWKTPLIQAYGFNAIPYTVLLNREGNIVGVGLRGAELERKLEDELAKK